MPKKQNKRKTKKDQNHDYWEVIAVTVAVTAILVGGAVFFWVQNGAM
ncbi:MAG: hypothetical protein U5L10_05070 [Candidatus Moranbacteria bacterium]|nr:hypothetical protein [Candidatus Moranbacteria bacterium]